MQADSLPAKPQGKLQGQTVTLCLTSKELPECFLRQLYHFIFPPALYRDLISPQLVNTVIICLFVKWYHTVVLAYVCLLTDDIEQLKISIFATCNGLLHSPSSMAWKLSEQEAGTAVGLSSLVSHL